MYAIIAFSEILILPQRRYLDLNLIPKMIRSCLYGRLSGFTGLRTLILGKQCRNTARQKNLKTGLIRDELSWIRKQFSESDVFSFLIMI